MFEGKFFRAVIKNASTAISPAVLNVLENIIEKALALQALNVSFGTCEA